MRQPRHAVELKELLEKRGFKEGNTATPGDFSSLSVHLWKSDSHLPRAKACISLSLFVDMTQMVAGAQIMAVVSTASPCFSLSEDAARSM